MARAQGVSSFDKEGLNAKVTRVLRQVPPPHQQPRTSQVLTLLFSGATASERILLTLNNNRDESLPVRLTAYTALGEETSLPEVLMAPQESKQVELSPLLNLDGLGSQKLGWLKVSYQGLVQQLGGQLTLYPSNGGPGLDSARTLDVDFASTRRAASFWVPEHGEARLALTNKSTLTIDVGIICGSMNEHVSVPAYQTRDQEVGLEDLGQSTNVGGVPVGCELSYAGSKDALRPSGIVRASGYSAPIRFYDPSTATSGSLTAVGLRLAPETFVSAYNSSSEPIRLNPIIREAALNQPYVVDLASQVIPPHTAIGIDLSASLALLHTKGIQLATLTLQSAAAKGVLVGSVTQVDSVDQVIEDIPLKTGNPANFAAGSYPLRWDGDYTNQVTVANTSDRILNLGGSITAGSVVYVYERQDVPPGSTVLLDVDKWRRDRVPDVNGNLLPLTATFGKIHWFERGNGRNIGLLGRQSLTSVRERRRSSFSCPSACGYTEQDWPYLDAPIFISMNMGGSHMATVSEYVIPTNGAPYTYPNSIGPHGGNLITTNSPTGVVAFTYPAEGKALQSAAHPGLANLEYTYFSDQVDYDPDFTECNVMEYETPQDGTSTVTPTVSYSNLKDLTLAKAGSQSAGTSNQITATGSPGGGSYSWTKNNNNISLANASGATVTTAAAAAGNSILTITYTVNGQSASANLTVNVFQPTSLAISTDTGVTANNLCYSGTNAYNGPQRVVNYQIQGKAAGSTTLVPSDVQMAETFSVITTGNTSCGPAPAVTSFVTHGSFSDTLNYCSTKCLPVVNKVPKGTCTLALEHVWTANGFNVFDHTLTYSCTNITAQ